MLTPRTAGFNTVDYGEMELETLFVSDFERPEEEPSESPSESPSEEPSGGASTDPGAGDRCAADPAAFLEHTWGRRATVFQTGGARTFDDLLTLDDVEIRPIGTAASAILTELSPGEHRIGLSGIAPNCTVPDGNPRTVTVTVGETVAEDIAVVCEAAPPATGGSAPRGGRPGRRRPTT